VLQVYVDRLGEVIEMDINLKNAYTKLINKHYSAVQTDTLLGNCADDDKFLRLERTAKQFWADYHEAEKEFLALLEGKGN
jgi:hypothetical protein